jgi:AAA+ ATPase superfamily predicted ATPase
LDRNIVDKILARGSPLYDEPRFLLMQELRDPHTYFSICRAVASGRTTPNEIAQGAGLSDRGAASRYLQTLRDLHVLERRVPATERNPERTRRGRYVFKDDFLRFWFRFVLPNVSALEMGEPERVYRSRVAPWLDQHLSRSFEDVCAQRLRDLNRGGALPAELDRIGGWWRGRSEVDIVAVADEGALLLGECKWSKNPVGLDVLRSLRAKVQEVAADLKREPTDVYLALFGRSGFTPAVIERAREGEVLLFGPEDLG